jgi:fatty-acyl-CoA synthase
MNSFTVADLITKTPTGQQTNPQGVAFTCDGDTRSYAHLHDNAATLAGGLLSAGFAKGDRVAVLMRNRPEWIETFFGAAMAGGVLVPLNYLLRSDELEFIVADSGARWIFYEDEFAEPATALLANDRDRRAVAVDPPGDEAPGRLLSYRALLGSVDTPSLPPVGPEDLVLLQYTSGTTGSPKGAAHTHSTVLWNSYHQLVDFAVSRGDVCYVTPALCWAAGFHDLALATLWAGGRLVLSRTSFEPSRFLNTVQRERVTTTLLVPTVLKRILAAPEFDRYELGSLRLVISGGEPVPITASEEMQRRLPGCAVLQVYGLSEFPTLMLLLGPGDAARKQGSTGKACSIAQVRVVTDEGRDVVAGEIGEIVCKSPAVMTGYYGLPEATATTLPGGWLHTGDLATLDAEGYVFISGRSKDMLITGGLNVYPAEVERILAQHPAILEAALIGVPDEQWGEVGQAHIVVDGDVELNEQELIDWLRPQLATFKLPRHYVVRTDPLPRTTSGKVQKFVLREPAVEAAPALSPEA